MTVGVELPDGGYLGVYCFLGEEPAYVVPVLVEMGYEWVKAEVERSLLQGGARDITTDKWETYYDLRGETSKRGDFLEDTWPPTDSCNTFHYRLRLDGSVDCLDRQCRPISYDPA